MISYSSHIANELCRMRRSFESGLRFELVLLKEYKALEPQITAMDCLSESVNTKSYDPEFNAMSIEYFITCFYGLFVILLIAITTLIAEYLNEKINQGQDAEEIVIIQGSYRPPVSIARVVQIRTRMVKLRNTE